MILVFVETSTEGVSTLSLEALGFARGVAAATGGDVHAIIVGELSAEAQAQLGEQGVATIHQGSAPGLERYAPAAWATAVQDVAVGEHAQVVLATASPRGNEVMAYVAARLEQPLATNALTLDPGDPATATRQVWGGVAVEELQLLGSPLLLTVAAHGIGLNPAPTATTPEVRSFTAAISKDDLVTQVVRTEAAATGGVDLAAARVVVGGGRGVGGPDSFDGLLELAALLGGALGVSRVVTSQGWRPHHEQVGQTGTRIAPDLYIACGISGAIQHMAGCQSAKTILAINTDADAPMVTKADYAIVGNLHEVVPAINAELRRRGVN